MVRAQLKELTDLRKRHKDLQEKHTLMVSTNKQLQSNRKKNGPALLTKNSTEVKSATYQAKQHLFHRTKYVSSQAELDRIDDTGKAISHKIMHGCNITGSDEYLASWWETYKNDVAKAITQQRSTCTDYMKNSFLGEKWVC